MKDAATSDSAIRFSQKNVCVTFLRLVENAFLNSKKRYDESLCYSVARRASQVHVQASVQIHVLKVVKLWWNAEWIYIPHS